MRHFFLALGFLAAVMLAPAAERRYDAYRFNGQEYVPLADWGAANGFKTSRLARGDKVLLANGTTQLQFDVDSHNAQINGVQVALSFPIANQRGVPLIAQFDLDKTVRPLLFPSRYAEPKRITTICLDPGHGGRDTGNRVRWYSEKVYTLLLANELRDQLRSAGFNVVLTRTRDAYVDLDERPALANRRGADLFVSLHFNATRIGRNEVEGPETYCITPVGASSSNAQGEGRNYGPTTANRQELRSLLLAYQVQKSLTRSPGVEDRGVRRARFAVLRGATMPAILIESGYMTHPVEGKKILTAAYRQQIAQAIVKGIVAYQKLTSPSPPPTAASPAIHRPAPNPGNGSPAKH